MLLERVITGGQNGADQGGWRAAREFGIPTGGFMPAGFVTEAGPRPEFAEAFGAIEPSTVSHTTRTHRNVLAATIVVPFDDRRSPGSFALIEVRRGVNKPLVHVCPGISTPKLIAGFLEFSHGQIQRPLVLLVAGNCESRCPGIGLRVEQFLSVVFRRFGQQRP